LESAIETALDMGVRLLDSAELYGNEAQIGQLLQKHGRPNRSALTLISKVWHTNHRPEHLIDACRQSRAALGVDTLDAYLLHGPQAWAHTEPLTDLRQYAHEEATALTFPTDDDGTLREADISIETTWRAMESLVERGWTRTIGVSNFDRDQLASLLDIAAIPPAINQIECHPYHPRTELVDFCQQRGIQVMAHSPLSAPGLLEDETLQRIADRHGVTPAQVVLRWCTQRGIVPIPSSTKPTHIRQNLHVFGFTLTADERASIDDLHQPDFSR
jgi:alcohol dehydrogenase (NADP+)